MDEKQIPKVGDTIIITNPGFEAVYGQTFTVVLSPYLLPTGEDYPPGRIWVNSEKGPFWLEHSSYKIAGPSHIYLSSCPDCHDTGKITLLTSTVKCDCRR